MKASELRELSIAELNQRLEELRVELFNLRFQKAKNLLDRADRLKEVKKDIARVLTVMKQKQTEAK
ncbi:MAG TPA: 50S ribosomal protein L29 [Candidatus Cloacimonadota bacterium]|nr:50S ribosomal protein L29 [Candidatus Cloacimonadota bacterium]HOV17268.1 50S ribosomal protein L29 [Candidatus Cloacimonadota bacterium]HQL14648.1 50S ribosomal protein L29 [Candidatus Cloacimonadota bacterium]